MGLTERRAIENYKKNSFESKCKELNDICGYPLQIEVNWESIEGDPQCVWFFERDKLNDYFFSRMNEALKRVCQDDMGKEAMKAKIDKIVFNNASGDLKFDGKTFVVNNRMDGSGAWGADQIADLIEKNL